MSMNIDLDMDVDIVEIEMDAAAALDLSLDMDADVGVSTGADGAPSGRGRAGDATRVGEIIAVSTTGFTAESYRLNDAPPFGALLRVAGPRSSVLTARSERMGPAIDCYYALCYGVETGSIEPGRHAVAWGRFEDDEDDIYRRQPQLQQVLRTTFQALLVGYEALTPPPPLPLSAAGEGGQRVSGGLLTRPSSADRDGLPSPTTDRDGLPSPTTDRDGLPSPTTGRDRLPSPTTGRDRLLSPAHGRRIGGEGSRGEGLQQRVPPTPPRLHALVHVATAAEVTRFNGSLTYLRLLLRTAVPNPDDFVAATITHAYEALDRDRVFLVAAARAVARLLGTEHDRVMAILELLDHE